MCFSARFRKEVLENMRIRTFALIFSLIVFLPLGDLVSYGKVSQYSAPDFQLVNQSGETINLSDFKGKIVVIDWIFTRCTDICLTQTRRFKKLQDELKEKQLFEKDVVLVSISIDPKHDTPEVLDAYAEKSGADNSGWHFLTGDFLTVQKVMGDYSYYAAKRFPKPEVADRHHPDTEYTFSHQERIYIIDQNGNLAKVNEGDSLSVSRVLQDIFELQGNKNES